MRMNSGLVILQIFLKTKLFPTTITFKREGPDIFQSCLTHWLKPIFTWVAKVIFYTMLSYVFALIMMTGSYLFTCFAFSSCTMFHILKLCQHAKPKKKVEC